MMTRHAVIRAAQRGIRQSDIELIVRYGTPTSHGRRGRHHRLSRNGAPEALPNERMRFCSVRLTRSALREKCINALTNSLLARTDEVIE